MFISLRFTRMTQSSW